jgi:hypothetical protein
MKSAAEIGSDCMIYIQNFMKIDTGVQAISYFSIRNLRGCNVGITDEWDFELYV